MSFLSPMQMEYRRNATHRWNIKTGATRSGKTYGDYYLIPSRFLEVHGQDGLNVILGNTKGTLQRNIIIPMQAIWGDKLVGSINSENIAMMFGEPVYCLGADNAKHVNRLRGMSIKRCYGDEVVTWNRDVFEMLNSRMDKPYSMFDGTCNPEGPTHWLKQFIDEAPKKGVDLYYQKYTIFDNPFLNELTRDQIINMHRGTVLYDRYVLGEWVAAEGAIYRPWLDDPARFTRTFDRRELIRTVIGVDFGGNGSAHAFVLLGFLKGWKGVCVLREYYRKDIITPDELERDFVTFAEACWEDYGVREVRCDSAETVLIKGLQTAVLNARLPLDVRNARKGEVNNRIRFTLRMMGRGAFFVDAGCKHLRDALSSAVWDAKHITEDKRLDDGSTNIDSLDAMEYAFEPYMSEMVKLTFSGRKNDDPKIPDRTGLYIARG